MTDVEHFTFADQCELSFPDQRHFHADPVLRWLEDKPGQILEIGGWKGELAAAVLPLAPKVTSWLNVEVSQRAIDAGVCHDIRYHAHKPDSFRWWESGFYSRNVIASHVLEHLSTEDVASLVAHLDYCNHWFVECPLNDEPQSWAGYFGSHILGVGWIGLEAIFRNNGFTANWVGDWIRTFSKGST